MSYKCGSTHSKWLTSSISPTKIFCTYNHSWAALQGKPVESRICWVCWTNAYDLYPVNETMDPQSCHDALYMLQGKPVEATVEQVLPAEGSSNRVQIYLHLKNYNKRHDRWVFSDDPLLSHCGGGNKQSGVGSSQGDAQETNDSDFVRPPPGLQTDADFSALKALALLCPPPRTTLQKGKDFSLPIDVFSHRPSSAEDDGIQRCDAHSVHTYFWKARATSFSVEIRKNFWTYCLVIYSCHDRRFHWVILSCGCSLLVLTVDFIDST